MFKRFYHRPVIGVTGPDRGGLAAWLFIWAQIFLAGGRAKRLTPQKPCDMSLLDGVVVGGGADVGTGLFEEDGTLDTIRQVAQHPSGVMRRLFFAGVHVIRLLGSYNVPQQHTQDDARDRFEMDVLAHAFAHDLPVLGICRGAQLLNVFCGGTLHRNLKSFYQEIPQIRTVLPRKEIEIQPKSLLASLLGRRCRVNALHWQAIDMPGRQMRVVAREKSSVIQAIEHQTHAYAIGVQWHPEFLLPSRRQRKLFSALVQTARNRLGVRTC